MSEAERQRSAPRERRTGIQVISRAAAILRALERTTEGLSLGEIAREVGLPRSTVQRIVEALDAENLLLASSAPRGVRLGPALLRLAAATRFEIQSIAHDTLEAISRQTGETVDLAVLDHDKVVFVEQVPGTHRLATASWVGASFPLHCSANGKAMLAALAPGELGRLKRRLKLTRATRNTIASWAALEKELERIRAAGVAYDREENTIGLCAVSMAFRCPTGELAAIAIPVPTQRFIADEQALTRALREGRDALRRELGG